MRKRDLQIFHIIKANENIRSKVRSNSVFLNIPVKRMRSDNCYSYICTRNVEEGLCRIFKLSYSGVQSYL